MNAQVSAIELLGEVMERPGVDREAFLDEACGNDAALRTQIRRLVRALDGAGDFLAAPEDGVTAAQGPGPLSEGPGSVIGRYKLLQQIGEGGFGVVFMAEQLEPIRRRVALKIIKPGMDTRAVMARFEAERQALAMMDHPNIARVLDAGATETGRPYFVMELVGGDRITEHCDKHNLSIPARLALFTQVCHAVQHAHQKGVIHRDLKPSNVLISVRDDRPHVKIIDFGIAKATAQRLTERTLFTEHRALIGTPEYISPEQAEGSIDIDTRTDVYSLGVILYELLTGAAPFDGRQLREAAFAEVQRIIREVEPARPSLRLSRASAELDALAAHRRSEPRKLGGLVRGDLDWIVMKALEKDRARRYESAHGLAADVERHLNGQAVVAAPPGVAYQVRKFVRRHRGPVAAGGLVAAALVLGVAGTSIGLIQAEQQGRIARQRLFEATAARDSESQARRAAQEQAAKLASLLGFLEQTMASVDPAARVQAFEPMLNEGAPPQPQAGSRVTMAEYLTRAAAEADRAFADQPLVEAAARRTIGNTMLGLGMPSEGAAQLRRAVDLFQQHAAPEEPLAVRARIDLCQALFGTSGVFGSYEAVAATLPLAQRILPPEDSDMLRLRSLYALCASARGEMGAAQAVRVLRDVAAAAGARYGPASSEALIAMIAVAPLVAESEGRAAAIAHARAAWELAAAKRGGDDYYAILAQVQLAHQLFDAQQWREASDVARDAAERGLRQLGARHAETAVACSFYGWAMLKLGDPHRAADFLWPVAQEFISGPGMYDGNQWRAVHIPLVEALATSGRSADLRTLLDRVSGECIRRLAEPRKPDEGMRVGPAVMVLVAVASTGQELDYARIKLDELEAAAQAAGVDPPASSPLSLRRTRGLILAKSGQLWPGVDMIEQTILEALAGGKLHAPAINSWVTSLLDLLRDQPIREQDCIFFDRFLGDPGWRSVSGFKQSVAVRNTVAWQFWLGDVPPQRILPWAQSAYQDALNQLGPDSTAAESVGDTYAVLLFECGRPAEAEALMRRVITLRDSRLEQGSAAGYHLHKLSHAAMLLSLGRSAEGWNLAATGCDGLFAVTGWANTPQRVKRAQKIVGWLVRHHEAAGHAGEAAALQQRMTAWLNTNP